jgi:heme/copper-type cytochrome/quinol oxidase subunit 2
LKRHPEHFIYTKEHGWQVKSFLPLAIVGLDVAVDRQINFQNPATLVMDGVIDLHHDIMAFLILIVAVVAYILFSALFNFREVENGHREFEKFGAITRHVNHHGLLEVI